MNPKDLQKKIAAVLPHLRVKEDSGRQPNEAQISQFVSHIFAHILGYDAFREIEHQFPLQNRRADLALKIDEEVKIIVEIKAKNESLLRPQHIEQAKHYGAVNGIRWVVLTNGVSWTLFYLDFNKAGIEEHKVFEISLEEDGANHQFCENLALLHRDSVREGSLEKFWKKARVVAPSSFIKILFSEETLATLRRQIRAQHKVQMELSELSSSLEVLLSSEIRKECGPIKIHKSPKRKRKVVKTISGQVDVPAENLVAEVSAVEKLSADALSRTQGEATKLAP